MKRRFRRLTPLLVWVGVLMLTVTLYLRQERGLTVTGIAAEVRYSVASETAGRLQRLEVTLNQDVSKGQIVASFETQELLLQLEEARAELERLAYELGRERALWQIDQQMNLRRFARDASNAHIEYLAALAVLAENRIEIQGLELTLNRTRQLEESELVPVATLDEDRIAYEALGEKIARQESAVASLLAAHHEAEARYREFLGNHVIDAPDPEPLLKPLQSAIEVQEIRIEMVNLGIVKRVLRAPAAGRVVMIFREAGEVVAAGQPVLSILEPRANQLVAHLPEHRILALQTGAEVKVRRVADPGQTYVSSVTCLGSSVEQMPQRLDPANVAPSWGLAIFISLPGYLEAIPGEAFEISF